MIMNLIVVVFVLGVTYAWMVRGVFNSFIHLICVLAAGAIAFAFWEPLAMMLINASPERGFFSFLEGIAFGVALVVPFVVMLIALRKITDKLIPNSITNSTIINYAGGAICGLGIAGISAGILVLGVETMRLSTNFLGYQPVWFSEDRATGPGSLVRNDTLWMPVDALTARLYGRLSTGTMSTAEPLARWYPELSLVGFSSRITPGDGSGRNAVRPSDFKVLSRYTVGNPNGTQASAELLKDSANDQPQKYLDINSEPVAKGYIAGYVLEFEPGAKERGKKGGQLVISNGQVRLLVENGGGQTRTVFPLAVISESSDAGRFGRWRFDAAEVFITSVGGKSRVEMGFEFLVPQGYSPIALYTKNIRVPTDSLPKATAFADSAARDRLVPTGVILTGKNEARTLDKSSMVSLNIEGNRSAPINTSTRIQQIMSTQIAKRGLTINEDDKNQVIDGEGIYDIKTEVGRNNAPLGKKLRVEQFSVASGQSLVRVDVGSESEIGLFSDAARAARLDQPPLLIDADGNEYEAIGYEYSDSEVYHIRFTRGSTLTGIDDTPTLSRTRSDQKLDLLFVVTKGAKIKTFAIGDVAIAEFEPPLETD